MEVFSEVMYNILRTAEKTAERMLYMASSILRTEKLCKSFSNGGTQQHVIKNLDLDMLIPTDFVPSNLKQNFLFR